MNVPNPVANPSGFADFAEKRDHGQTLVEGVMVPQKSMTVSDSYPQAFPSDSLAVLGGVILGTEKDKKKIAKAAYLVEGYALLMIVGEPDQETPTQSVPMHTDCPVGPEAQHAALMDCAEKQHFPMWIVPLLVEVLQKVLTNNT